MLLLRLAAAVAGLDERKAEGRMIGVGAGGGVGAVLAHHPYDYIWGFGIALAGILLITWAERRTKARKRSDRKQDPS